MNPQMAQQNGAATTEQTPLLVPPRLEDLSDAMDDEEQAQSHHDGPNQSVGPVRAVLIILSLWILIFLQSSNMSGLTTAQSAIAADLDAYSEANWFTSTYLITTSSISPLVGRLSQIFSPRSCIFVSSICFALGAFVTSQAKSLEVFLIGRGISGLGAAGIMTISLILVLELTSKKRRGLFVGLVNTGYTIGVAMGAVLAGAVYPVFGWRTLFWFQTPLALLAGIGVFFSIPHHFVTDTRASKTETLASKLSKVDYLGAALLTSSIVLFLYGLSSTHIQYVPIIISLLLLPLFILNGLYLAPIPIIPLTILHSRGPLLTCLAQLCLMAARWTVLFYTPVYEIAVQGWSPARAGSILISTNLGFATGGIVAGALHIRRTGSFYLSSLTTISFFSLTLYLLSTTSTNPHPSTQYIFPLLTFLNGLSTGSALNYTLAHMLHLTFPSTHFIATSLLATFRGFAGSFGAAIGGGHFVRELHRALEKGFTDEGLLDGEGKEKVEELIRRLIGGPALVAGLEGRERAVAEVAYARGLSRLWGAAAGVGVVVVGIQALGGWRGALGDGQGDGGGKWGSGSGSGERNGNGNGDGNGSRSRSRNGIGNANSDHED